MERRDRPARGRPTSTRRSWSSRQAEATGRASASASTLPARPLENWGEKEWINFGVESQNWTLSQFLHGEQGALICTAKIVESVPWIDAKYYAATQVMDEARHVEVFAKYLDEKLSGHYPINAHLRMLLDDIIADSRWDMTYLGMQIMVEGLALAAFGFMHSMTTDPLLKQLLRYVMADEARHVAFGVLSLQEYYEGLTTAELRERQEFAFEAAVRMRDRFLQQEVWDRMGVDPKAIVPVVQQAPERGEFQALLFSKIVPNCKKLGLLDAADGWLRTKFTELGVIEFESWVDTTEEYDAMASVPPTEREPDLTSGERRRPGDRSRRRRRSSVLLVACGSVTPPPDPRPPARGLRTSPRFGSVVTAMVTPFGADGALDLDAAATVARHLADTGSDGLVVAGTTGEGPVLTDAERIDLFRAVVEAVDVPVIAVDRHQRHRPLGPDDRGGRGGRRRRRPGGDPVLQPALRRPGSPPTSGPWPRPPTCRCCSTTSRCGRAAGSAAT